MEKHSASEVTKLLQAWSAGDQNALEKLVPLVEQELRRLAKGCLRRENSGHILQTTGLINEAYMRLIGGAQVDWHDRAHFFAVSARLMRRILIDYSRRQSRLEDNRKPIHVTLDETLIVSQKHSRDLVALDDALCALTEIFPRKGQIVELRFFGGLSVEEVAEVLEIAPRTVMREWNAAKAWLYHELSGGEKDDP
jgi:RNA polymerase sigma factor (TIGR02999 family)